VAFAWQQAARIFQEQCREPHFRHWFDTFAPERAPQAGELWRAPDHAQTLQSIAESNADSFYRGPLAPKIAGFVQSCGGYLAESDLADFAVQWCEPVSVNYRGYDVWEIPPNGQGLVALIALNLLQGFEFPVRDALLTYHRQIEAIKLAFADGMAHIADPAHMRIAVPDLLSQAYADERRRLIGKTALQPLPGEPPRGGTVYLATADAEGNMVSMIQSNYMGFGSGLVVPGTGIALHNRGNNFSMQSGHPNCVEPGKRPYHTIIPGFLTRNAKAIGPFGVMGGFMQPQGHVQMVMNTVDFGLNPQAALDAPRWEWERGKRVMKEQTTAAHLFHGLAGLGHDVAWSGNRQAFGRGQIIWRNAEGSLCGGTEPRADGTIAAW
jgi:gamma-glutamyltranspeptidase/glutathione hydrolase